MNALVPTLMILLAGAAGFDAKPQAKPSSGFGSPQGSAVDAAVYNEQAQRFFKELDANRNNKLERSEWRRIKGDPEKADYNNDSDITLSELTARLREKKTGQKPPSSYYKAFAKARPAAGDKKSYRFTPPKERLPKELPSWFASKDRDGDGQVAMAEYARSWTKRDAEEFRRRDANGDGFITPTEAR